MGLTGFNSHLVSSNPHCKTLSHLATRIILCSHDSYPSPLRWSRNQRSPGNSLTNLSYKLGGRKSRAPTSRLSFAARAEHPVANTARAANSNSGDLPPPRPHPAGVVKRYTLMSTLNCGMIHLQFHTAGVGNLSIFVSKYQNAGMADKVSPASAFSSVANIVSIAGQCRTNP